MKTNLKKRIRQQQINSNKLLFMAILFLYSINAISQQNISGTITDNEGEVLPGASILEKGTANGTTSDFDGNYTISLTKTSSTFLVSYVGYITQEIKATTESVINVQMKMDANQLDEIIIIGYGDIKKSDLTTAVSKVEGDKLENRMVSNLSQALSGQLSGVKISQSSGAPGAAPEINIRGVGSLSGDNGPLYIIDGFPVEDPLIISSLDFSNIESVQVLKDAASTAIYGARGANGIIVVTSKQGEENNTSLNLKVNMGVQDVLKRVDYLTGPEFTEHRWHARQNAWVDRGGNLDDPNNVRPSAYRVEDSWLIPGDNPNYDVQDWLFKAGKVRDYNLTASGGKDGTRFLVSGSYFDQEGVVRNSGYDRASLRIKVSSKINNLVTLGTSLYTTYARTNNSDFEGKAGLISPVLITQRPNVELLTVGDNEYGSTSNKFANAIEHRRDKKKQMSVSGNTYMDFNLAKGLKFRTTIGYFFSNEQRDLFDPIEVTQRTPPIGRAWNTTRRKWQIDNTLSYKVKIKRNHNLTALLGQSAFKIFYNTASIYGLGYPNSLSHTLNNATSYDLEKTYTLENENSMSSYFGRLNYSYSNRYLLAASLRMDGSSRFGSDSKWGKFPAISGGWNVMNEVFFGNLKEKINTLKIRASWGITGNNGIPSYQEYSLLKPANTVFGNNEAIALGLTGKNVSNPDLRWEQSEMINLGLDLGFMKNRIQLGIEYYIKTTNDLLLDVPISTTTGFGTALLNYGSLENKGWEFDLTTKNINTDFKWSTNLNVSLNSNKVLALGPDNAPIENGVWYAPVHITKVGETIGAFYMYEAIGVFKDQAELDSYPAYPGSKPGDIKIKDQLTLDTNGDGIPDEADGVIDTQDRAILGSGIPTYFWGITNNFNYKNLELSVLLSGAGGNKVYNAVSRQSNVGTDGQMFGLWKNAWRSPENPGDGVTPRANRNPTGANRQYNSRYLYDGDYWKIANITLSYNFEKEFIHKIGIASAKCFVTADNVYLSDKYSIGHNPEVNEARGNPFRQGDDYNTYPLTRTISLGIQLGF